ncbi:hypothetical protein [uncultured Maritimibacter sp.]|jgi:hypothetical protein|uniref:hypothetical protein n=1 Tax=uncultured Maritimibacter sp. TaxID=991866 RepID=UPI0026105F23|nr:hypothetical protein [uncultured Maritimibacter sp.]
MSKPAFCATFLRLWLPRHFLLAGGAVMLVALVIVGDWVSGRIEQGGVVQSAAASAADFVETFVAPLAEDFSDAEDDEVAALGIPLLEVYSPSHAYFSGDVVAVVEFYQIGSALADELARTRLNTWLVVGGAFVVSGVLLFGIVLAGGRTIERRRELLES